MWDPSNPPWMDHEYGVIVIRRRRWDSRGFLRACEVLVTDDEELPHGPPEFLLPRQSTRSTDHNAFQTARATVLENTGIWLGWRDSGAYAWIRPHGDGPHWLLVVWNSTTDSRDPRPNAIRPNWIDIREVSYLPAEQWRALFTAVGIVCRWGITHGMVAAFRLVGCD